MKSPKITRWILSFQEKEEFLTGNDINICMETWERLGVSTEQNMEQMLAHALLVVAWRRFRVAKFRGSPVYVIMVVLLVQ